MNNLSITVLVALAISLSSFSIGALFVTPITQSHITEATRLCEPHRGIKEIQPNFADVDIICVDAIRYTVGVVRR